MSVRSYLTALNKLQKFCDTRSSLSEILYELKNNKLDPVDLLDDFYCWLNNSLSNLTMHPVELCALAHLKFVSIHPFSDGNGRISMESPICQF